MVRFGTKDSVRPDHVTEDYQTASFETKDYNLWTNHGNLVREIVRQAEKRAQHLPKGMKQNILIYPKGMPATAAREAWIRQQIVERSRGVLRSEGIRFVRE